MTTAVALFIVAILLTVLGAVCIVRGIRQHRRHESNAGSVAWAITTGALCVLAAIPFLMFSTFVNGAPNV